MQNDHKAASKALSWLISLEINPADSSRQLQRLLGIWAGSVIKGEPESKMACGLSRSIEKLAQFDHRNYDGDAILALGVHGFLLKHGIVHSSLADLSLAYARVLQDVENPPEELNLVSHHLLHCGFKVPTPINVCQSWPAMDELVHMNRRQVIRFCQTLASKTLYGRRHMDYGSLTTVLPLLSVSYARDWDLEAVIFLLRACAYIGVQQAPPCIWVREWLLDQQQADGSFGLLKPEGKRAGINVDDWQICFLPTVGALWALAEWHRPGFLLEPEISNNVLKDKTNFNHKDIKKSS